MSINYVLHLRNTITLKAMFEYVLKLHFHFILGYEVLEK